MVLLREENARNYIMIEECLLSESVLFINQSSF